MTYNIFTTLDPLEDITSLRGTEVTTGLWSNDTGSLSTVFTQSAQVATSGEYYYDLYNGASSTTSDIQFSVAYGHVSGGGSPTLATLNTSTLPTQVTYVQYRNILLASDVEKFAFDGVDSDDIYVINLQRSRIRQALDPGNWQLGLSGSKGLRTFIDNSGLGTAVVGNLVANNVYEIRSGSLSTTPNVFAGDSTVYGLVFPDYGVIILNPSAISSSVGFSGSNSSLNARTLTTAPFAPYTGSNAGTTYQYQHEGLVRSISSSMAAGNPFIARSAETITSTNYFIRLRNSQYNFSNNPTYYTGSNPQNVLEPFRVKPITYPTTIGLYNDQNELLAVAKLSRPIQKSNDKEALIRVRLDF
jgi:hypothetical protein